MVELDTFDYRIRNGLRAFRSWFVPYARSRAHPDEFRPMLSYLFTEWRCNMHCSYCFTYGNSVEGMSLDTAYQAIDWLKTTGCRVIAIMGGEPLLRKEFIEKVVAYGSQKSMFMYLPTNGTLLDEPFIDRIGRAGIAAVNVAIDRIDPIPGMPKALSRIEKQLECLIRRHREHGFLIFLNVNITALNLDDVRKLTEFAAAHHLGIDFHINEPPVIKQARSVNQDTFIGPKDYERLDELIDWLVARHRGGQVMINSVQHLLAMKRFVRGDIGHWGCRAGQNSVAVKIDGSLSPCFGRYSADEDWGTVWNPKFDREKLNSMKIQCSPHCLSTCQFNLHHYFTWSTILYWVRGHSRFGGYL